MKKIVLSLAGVLAATAFAPEASAVPSFARQTGMACTACHAQHFPILNSFGRAFKAAGYTMMGAQGKVEGEHLSIPDALNASLLLKIRYYKDNTAGRADTRIAPPNKGNGEWQVFDEGALFFGGRVAENMGFLMEGNIVSGGQLLAGFKMPFVFDVGGAKLSVIPFTTDAMGAQYGYEQSSGGVLRANRWNENRRETSAVQYNADRNCTADNAMTVADETAGDCGAATGIALVAQNDFGFINLTKWSPSFVPGGNGQSPSNNSTELKSSYVRIAATPTLGGWSSVIGFGKMSGSSYSNVAAAKVDTDQTFFDAQFQGEVAGKEMGVYFQHAKAPSGKGVANAYNSTVCAVGAACLPDRKATTIGVDYTVIPHALSVSLAYRSARTGGAVATDGDNATTLGLVYDLTQNVALHAGYMSYSGSAHTAVGAVKHQYMGMLEAAF